MPKIFISYRRADSKAYAGRLHDRLVTAFGAENVFMDVNNDNIPLGRDFRGVLRESVAKCDVLLALIGKQWLTISDESGSRRLDNPNDFVRIEIESALQRTDCLVIPVAVDNASMPGAKDLPNTLSELAYKNAALVRDDPDFHPDMDKIIRAINASDKNPVSSSRSVKLQSKTHSAYDVHKAIENFHDAFDAKEWKSALNILDEIRASNVKIPRTFNIDMYARDVSAEIETEECEREYNILRRMAKAKNPHATRIWEALQTFWESYPDYDPDDIARFKLILAQDHFDRAQKRANNDYDGKIEDYNEAIRLNPQFAEAYFQRALIYDYGKKDHEQAAIDYTETIRFNSYHAKAYAERGGYYILLKHDPERGIADLNQAILIDPTCMTAYFIRANFYYHLKDYDAALADYNRLISLDPQHILAHQNIGNIYRLKRDYDQAILNYTEVIRNDPQNSIVYNNLGLTYFEKKEYEQAIAEYTQAIRLNSHSAIVYNNRGFTYYQKKDYERAIDDFTQALILDPQSVIAYNSRGLCYHEKQDYEQAIADFSAVIRLYPEDSTAYNNRGTSYFYKKDYERAIDDYETVLEIDPNNPVALRSLKNSRNMLKKQNGAS